MEASATPTCRVCGREIVPNARGDYVACCSPYVAPPARESPVRAVLRPWLHALEWVFIGDSRGISRYARLGIALGTIGLLLAGLLAGLSAL